VAVAVVSSLGAGGYLALRPARHVAPAHTSTTPARPAAAPVVIAPPVVASPEPAPAPPVVNEPAPRARRLASRRAPAPDGAAALSEETALLRDADRALRVGDTAGALARLDEHAARFPHGALAPERTAERLIVLCELGVADPRAVARFLAEGPGSPLAARVRRACAPPKP
jgi:hypothetical protein